jgi:hypothetical protein
MRMTTMSDVNLRRHYDLYLWTTAPVFRGTPRQIAVQVADWKRVHGNQVPPDGDRSRLWRVVDPRTGEVHSVDDVLMATWTE